MMRLINNRWTAFLYLFALLGMAAVPAVLALPSYQEEPCVGEMECYEDPPILPEVPIPEITNPQPESSWSGFSDGRLSPDMAEYYSVWCVEGFMEVWRGVPAPLLLVTISITDAFLMEIGGTMALVDSMTLVRHDESVFTIYGNNGNLAPQHGLKTINLSVCPQPTAAEVEQPAIPSVDTSSITNLQTDPETDDISAGSGFPTCADYLYFVDNFGDCLNGLTSQEKLIDLVLRCMYPLLFPTIVVSFAAFKPRRKRK